MHLLCRLQTHNNIPLLASSCAFWSPVLFKMPHLIKQPQSKPCCLSLPDFLYPLLPFPAAHCSFAQNKTEKNIIIIIMILIERSAKHSCTCSIHPLSIMQIEPGSLLFQLNVTTVLQQSASQLELAPWGVIQQAP